MSKNKLRSVNTRFWEDPFIENLNPSEKLLFLYFLTNPLANILGIYEISIKRICYDTGLNKSTVEETLKGFKSLGKVFYVDSYIILSNFLKNQNLNPNMFTGAVELFNNLPISVKNSVLNNDLKAFERVLKASQDFEKYESEYEIESEYKKENIIEISKDDIDKIYSAYPSKCIVKKSSTGKTTNNKSKIETILKKGTYSVDQLLSIIDRYVKECKETNTFMKNFATFLNNIPDYTEQKQLKTDPEQNDGKFYHKFDDSELMTKIEYRKDSFFQQLCPGHEEEARELYVQQQKKLYNLK